MPLSRERKILRRRHGNSTETPKGFSRMATEMDGIQKSMDTLAAISKTSDRLMTEVYNRAAQKVAPMVVGFLKQNLAESGVGHLTPKYESTGKIANAIANVSVTIEQAAIHGGGNAPPRLVIKMPRAVQPYKGGSDFYTVAASINFGAVHASEHVGARARRTIKKYALTKKISQRELKAIETAYFSREMQGVRRGHRIGVLKERKRVVYVGKDVVIKPHNFYQLRPSQKARILGAFLGFVKKELEA